MTDPIEPVTNDKIYGMMAALQVSLRALTKSHPNPAALIFEFHQEHEENLGAAGGAGHPRQRT